MFMTEMVGAKDARSLSRASWPEKRVRIDGQGVDWAVVALYSSYHGSLCLAPHMQQSQ